MQALLRMNGSVLLKEFLSPHVFSPNVSRSKSEPMNEPSPTAGTFDWDEFFEDRIGARTRNLYAGSLGRMEREILIRVLRHTSGNQLQAARILGITRGSLRNKIRTLGISITQLVDSQTRIGD